MGVGSVLIKDKIVHVHILVQIQPFKKKYKYNYTFETVCCFCFGETWTKITQSCEVIMMVLGIEIVLVGKGRPLVGSLAISCEGFVILEVDPLGMKGHSI